MQLNVIFACIFSAISALPAIVDYPTIHDLSETSGLKPVGTKNGVTGPRKYFLGDDSNKITLKINWDMEFGDKKTFDLGNYAVSWYNSKKDGQKWKLFGCMLSKPSGANDGSQIVTLHEPVYDGVYKESIGGPCKDVPTVSAMKVYTTLLVSDPDYDKVQVKVLTTPGADMPLKVNELFTIPYGGNH